MIADRRWLFTITILTGSFLLFLVQPMVARMAMPQLGGAPNVWNSAMLVYQALLLGGYAYAHAISGLPLRRQGLIHLGVLLLAALSLPLALAEIAPPTPGWEPVWVPWLFLLSVGPAFFAVSAQAPLMQRWFAAHPAAGNPYPLYAASNLGSFAGLLAYPLLAEPLLPLGLQSTLWSAGYGVLILLVGATVLARRGNTVEPANADEGEEPDKPISARRIGLWLALSAVPSGLLLSTTTHLTTDIMAMPLLWVIPLGLYLLSFSIAFAANREIARLLCRTAPIILLVTGSLAMFAAGRSNMVAALASVVLLFVVAVALHARLYNTRPEPVRLTTFYLVMAAGGALGGLFTALIAPLIFDWTWEHWLLIVAAAALLPLDAWRGLPARLTAAPSRQRLLLAFALFITFMGSLWLYQESLDDRELDWSMRAGLAAILLVAFTLAARRWSFVLGSLALLLSLGGFSEMQTSWAGGRERSYFGIYSLYDEPDGDRVLKHGTTLHGMQRFRSGDDTAPTTYYGPSSGVGLALQAANDLFGEDARIGVVGLGVGTLACYKEPRQDWTFFEIDPVVLEYSRDRYFTFLDKCAPDSPTIIGDARIELDKLPPRQFDLLAVDAFSSDAIPLHLLTLEALDIYLRSLEPDGVILLHISNRFVELEPVIARLAEARSLSAAVRHDVPSGDVIYASGWIALTRDPDSLAALTAYGEWDDLKPPKGEVWTDDYASILGHLAWENFL